MTIFLYKRLTCCGGREYFAKITAGVSVIVNGNTNYHNKENPATL